MTRNRNARRTTHRRLRTRLTVEPLETRLVLSASGLVPVGSQPTGALSGKIAYVHAGHGWTADNLGNGAWTTQRPALFQMVEDLGNQDQVTFFADYLFNAGATVAALRPIGYQPNEVVLDNDDPEVSFNGSWNISGGSVYFGDAGDVPYQFATASATETAYARYQPNIPEAGFYPVYTWAKSGSNRAEDQLYRVHHTGGTTEVTVNHRRVGDGTVYLGTYYFDAGTDGYVDISNRSDDTGRVVVADMIRFGNGMGDIDRGGGVSGKSRSDEAGLYWVKWHVDNSQGIPDSEYRASSDDRVATVSLSPRYAEFMNNASDGSLSDRVFVSYHSNAGGGRGVIGLHNGNNSASAATPNQTLLALRLAEEVNDDVVAQNNQFEHNWLNRTSLLFDAPTFEFGEINNTHINNEFDATIVETGFHDNQLDAELLRDATVRDAIAKATVQGLVKYFNNVDGGSTAIIMAPGQVSDVRAESVIGTNDVTISWNAPNANAFNGDAATGYRIYASLDGYGFDGGTYVAGGDTLQHTFTGLDPQQGAHYFKVVAVNDGGEGPDSEVMAAIPNSSGPRVLIVNGFDRLGRTLNPREDFLSGEIERVRPRFSNSFDYAVQAAEAIEAYGSPIVVDTASNETIATNLVSLNSYDAVVWILGEESSADDTFDAGEQFWVSNYLNLAAGKLFVSGAEIGWDLDNLNNGRTFYENELRANYVSDDANTYTVTGVVGSIFEGLTFSFDDGTVFYDAQFPDVIAGSAGSTTALNYVGGSGGGAAVQYGVGAGASFEGRLVNFGFPFETILGESNRAAVMDRVLDYFNLGGAIIDGDFDDDTFYTCNDIDALVEEIVNVKNGGAPNPFFDLSGDGTVNDSDLDLWLAEAGSTGGLTASGNPVQIGDANLDGVVDGLDFIEWNNFKFTSTAAWCEGDFNADGITDGVDFILWNAEKFTAADLRVDDSQRSVDESDPVTAQSSVNEVTAVDQERALPSWQRQEFQQIRVIRNANFGMRELSFRTP